MIRLHKNLFRAIALAVVLDLAGCAALVDDSVDYSDLELVWSDEFSIDGPPDPGKWNHESGFVRNRELQWYKPENAVVEGGALTIEAREEQLRNPGFERGTGDWRKRRWIARYTSASITTRGLHEWQYGRVEVRAKIPSGNGVWPVIWTVGSAPEWPASGEIDIMESYRGYLLANAAWASDTVGEPMWDEEKRRLESLGGVDWTDQFHVWSMDWDEHRITLSVDGEVLNVIDVGEARNPAGISPEYPFRQPHFLFLSLAIGGSNGGKPDGGQFPARMHVDYVRVYQRNAGAF